MKRRFFLLAGGAVVLAAGWGVLAWGDPRNREMRRVEKRLLALAEAVSFSEKDSMFLRLGYPEKVRGFFGPTTELDITVGSREAHATLVNSELKERVGLMRATAKGLSVQFLDVAVTMNEALNEATAHLTSKIYFTGEPDYLVQEFRVQLGKQAEQGWRVSRIGTVRTME